MKDGLYIELTVKAQQRRKDCLSIRHSSVESLAPAILWPRVRIPSTTSKLFAIYIAEIILCRLNWNVKRTKINKKEAGIG